MIGLLYNRGKQSFMSCQIKMLDRLAGYSPNAEIELVMLWDLPVTSDFKKISFTDAVLMFNTEEKLLFHMYHWK
jgi:hypothetical protein